MTVLPPQEWFDPLYLAGLLRLPSAWDSFSRIASHLTGGNPLRGKHHTTILVKEFFPETGHSETFQSEDSLPSPPVT